METGAVGGRFYKYDLSSVKPHNPHASIGNEKRFMLSNIHDKIESPK